MEMQSSECINHHPQIWPCNVGPPKTCHKCERLAKLAKEKQQRDLEDKLRRDAEQKAHLERIDSIDKEIEQVRISQEKARLAVEREIAIKQREADLVEALRTSNDMLSALPRVVSPSSSYAPSSAPAPSAKLATTPTPVDKSVPPPSTPSGPVPPKPSFFGKILGSVSAAIQPLTQIPLVQQKSGKPFVPLKPSPSEQEWRRLKNVEGMTCSAIDAVMDMTGLEAIKEQVLKVKAKIDTSRRQGASLKNERFNVVFLGNPGTGMSKKLFCLDCKSNLYRR